jgi:WD40 repeat protein
LSCSRDKTVKILDTASGRCLESLAVHGISVLSVAFSPNGQRLASCSRDKAVKIWDAASGRCIETIDIGTPITHISFDYADDYLLTNIGRIKMARAPTESSIRLDDPEGHGYRLGQDRAWIACNGQNVLWLPTEYRPGRSAVQGRMISIGCISGRVYFIGFSRDV